MSDQNNKFKISENPSIKGLKALMLDIKALGTVFGFSGKIGVKQEKSLELSELAKEIEIQAEKLDLPDRFNKIFCEKGWICVGTGISVEVMEDAIGLAEDGEDELAEQALVNWFTEKKHRSVRHQKSMAFSSSKFAP